MAVNVTYRGVTYAIPSPGESNDWGAALTAYLVALGAAAPTSRLAGVGTAALSALALTPQSAPTGPNAVGDLYVTSGGALMICTVAGSPGTWTTVGPTAGPTGVDFGKFGSYADESRVWGVASKLNAVSSTVGTWGMTVHSGTLEYDSAPTLACPRAMNEFRTDGTINSRAGIHISGGMVAAFYWQQRPRVITLIQSLTTVANKRIWVALTDGHMYAVTSDPSLQYVGLRLDTSVGNTWMLCSSNGTTASETDTGIVAAPDVDYNIDVDFSVAGTLTARINGVAFTKTTHLPVGTANYCNYEIVVTALSAAVQSILWHHTMLSRK